jgi:hypothetical protein
LYFFICSLGGRGDNEEQNTNENNQQSTGKASQPLPQRQINQVQS